MVPFGGAVALTAVAVVPLITQPTYRWFWLKPCVTAPGLISTTSAIADGEGVCTEKPAPWATMAGELVIVGRGLKKYAGEYRS